MEHYKKTVGKNQRISWKHRVSSLIALILVFSTMVTMVFPETVEDDDGAIKAAPEIVFAAENAANGTEGEEGDEPVAPSGEEDTREGENTRANMLDFIPPGTLTLIHKATGEAITEENPARPGEQVQLTVSIHEINVGNILQFDMDQMYLNIPAGIKKPDEDITDTSTVQIKDTDQQIYDLPNTYTIGKNGVITYDWNHDHHEIRNGVDHDVYYMACHTADLSYSITLNLTVGTDADEIHFDDNHSYPVDRSVTLTVTKAISGVSDISLTQAQQMTFAVYDTDGNPVMKDGQPVTFTRAEMEGTIANASKTISGLTADEYPAVFVVKETGHPEYEGFTFLTAGDGVVTQQTVEIPAGQSATANLKNRYSQDVSNLKIKKVFLSGSDKTFDNLTTAEKQKISFKVYDAEHHLIAEANLSEENKFNNNGEWLLENLAPGAYTVEETADLEGYTRTTTYQVDTSTAATGDSASVTLVKDETHLVQFNNTYERQNGKLKLKKSFAGATDSLSDADKNKIKFTITAPDGTVIEKTYADFTNGELLIDPALAGTYKVVESNTATTNYSITTTYSVNGGTPTTGTTASDVEVPANEIGEVVFTNTYTELGKITLTKKVDGNYWDDFGNSYDTQSERRSRIRSGVIFNLYRIENGQRVYVSQKKLSDFYNSSSGTTWSNLPVGTYEIDEVVSGTDSSGGIIANTIRTTSVAVNGGTAQTAANDATTIASGSFSVTKGGTSTVAYQNDYYKKTGKIKFDKKVFVDGEELDLSTFVTTLNLTEAQQKNMKFTVSGKDLYGNNESKVVSLYDILHAGQEGSVLDANGYLVVDYSNTSSGYTVTESGADLANYIRVTTGKLDNGEYGPGASVSSVKIDATTEEHTVTFKNEYTSRGRIMVDKTVSGLSAADEATVRDQIYFTIVDSSGRPIIKENGKYVLGQTGAEAAHIPLSELTAENGIELPTGTFVLTEHNGDFNTDVYTWSVTNVIMNDGGQIDERQSVTSGNATVTIGNVKHVGYTNTYTRKAIGPGGGVTIRKRVLLDGVEIDANYTGVHAQLYSTVMAQIRFKIYEGDTVDPSKLIEGCPADGYTYAQLQASSPFLTVGTYTIQETNYNVAHYTHAIRFTVDGHTTLSDHVTITLTQDKHINIDVYNGYIPLGDLEVQKLFGEGSDLKAADLTDAQKSAIRFSVIGYADTNYDQIVWPEQNPDATEPQPEEFTYADMTPNANGVMSKVFNDIPTGVYVVTESADITNYTLSTIANPEGNALSVPWNTTGTQTAVKTFTNTYIRQKGNLVVTKTFDAPDTLTAAQRGAITFTVTGPDPSMPRSFTYAQMTGGTYTIEDVVTGTYTVKETNADFDFFVCTTTATVNEETTTYSDTDGVSASVVYDQTASVHITNKYQETGALIINKSFDDSECINKLTAAQKSRIEFTVWRVLEDGSKEVVKTITYDEILKWMQLNSSQNPEGYRFLVLPGEYIIEESNADFSGYVRTTTATVNGTDATVSEDSVTATVAKFEEGKVVFTNKYNERGKLKVKKSVEGLDYNSDQKNAVTFTVTQGNDVIATFTYADILGAGGEYVISDLPAGTYTVTETVTDEESVFYGNTRRTYVKVGTGGETEHSFGDVLVDKTEDDNVVIFRNKYVSSTKLAVQKEIGGAPKVYIEKEDGKQYPVWKFNLHITNLDPSTTSNGTTYLIDTYDRDKFDLFKIVTDPADLAAIYAEDPEGEGKANILVPVGEGSAANVTLEPDYEDGEVAFKISGVTDDTAKSNDLTYYLIPKDGVALEALNARDNTVPAETPSNMLKKNFSNVVKYKELPLYSNYAETNWVNYQYEKTVVIKKCLNYNVERKHLVDEYGHDVNYALYEFIVNPEEMKLSTSGYIDVRDEFSENQSVSVESIKVERCVYDLEQNKVISTSPAQDGDVTYKDLHGFEIDLTLKDEICFRVTYTSTLLFTAAQADSPQMLSNKVFVDGYYDGTEPVVIPSSQGTGNLYQVRLLKYQNGNLDNTLRGAQFKMYLDGDAAEAAKDSGDYSQAIATYETDKNGVIVITEYYINGVRYDISANSETPITYYFVESVAPAGYEKINYVVQVRLAAPGETAQYGPDVWIYLPSDTVGIREYPFDTSVDLGALKTFETNGSERQLVEGEFSFRIRAKNNADIPMPEGTTDGEKIVANGADGKAVFGTIPYDTEDVVTRDNTGTVTSTTKTFVYEVSEVLPDGLDANGNKDGVHYDTHVYEIAVTVAVSNDNVSLNVTGVTVDGKSVTADDNNVYFVGLENEYTAEGVWTPVIQKDLQGRPLKKGEFTFQIKNGEEILATGTNNADGTVTMDPESLTFTLDDLGENVLTVHEVYTAETDDGMYEVAADETVTVTVAEKKDEDDTPIYDGSLIVTSDKATLTAPLVMTNKFKASGSWHPNAEKTLTGVLKLNESDFEFELAAVGDAPMPEGAENGKLVIACDADGKVDFGQIDFYQGNFDDEEYTDGDKEFHYTIREVIPDPEDRIFGVVYDDTVYNITVTTTINKTNKLGVAVTCDPEDGWDLDESTATFTGQFENTYGPTPAKAQPGYEKYLTGEIPTEDVTFEFKLEKAAGDNGDFDYVKVGDAPFTTQTKTLTLGPSSQTDSGLFDEITFLVEGTYKFKITETPNTNGALDPCFVYDSKEYTYTVVVTGVGENLQAAGAYSSADEDQTEQTAEIAVFTNKYTPAPTLFIPKAHKRMSGEPTVEDKTFTFTMTPDAANPDEGVYHDDTPFQGEDAEDTVIVVVPAGQTDAEELFSTMTFRKAGTYKFHVEEIIPATPIEDGITYDTVHWTLTIEVEDRSGQLTIISNEAKQDKDDGATDPDGMTTFTNHVPKTDDVSDMYLNTGMMLASGLLLLLIAVFGRKRKA